MLYLALTRQVDGGYWYSKALILGIAKNQEVCRRIGTNTNGGKKIAENERLTSSKQQ